VSRHPLLVAAATVIVLTIFLTWPQALHLGGKVAEHNDPLFSAWRLSWIAHALKTDPRRLFDANIYFPERQALAYSDATMLEGALAAPFLWAGSSPILVYNLLLLTGIAASGLAMFVRARRLTGNSNAAIVSAAVFTLLPYRIEHVMHLELQWTMWMPLAFWSVHRSVEERSWRWGAVTGLFVWLQILSCVYYGIFLSIAILALGALLIATTRGARAVNLGALALGAVIAAALTVPYAWPYIENARALGPRAPDEIARFSARLASYVTAPAANWLWGGVDRFSGNELNIFPGAVAVLLAVAGLAGRPRRLAWIYLAVGAIAVDMSLGANGFLYPRLLAHAPMLGGLRAPARFSIVAFCALAVLAGFGADLIERRVSNPHLRRRVTAAAVLLLLVECGSAPLQLMELSPGAGDIYRVLRELPPGPVAELPMPRPDTLPHYDAFYEYWSIYHWKPLINGYSGYAPAGYLQTLEQMRTFPDDRSVARLKELNVRYIVVHQNFFETRAQFTDLVLRMAVRPELLAAGRFRSPEGGAELFELR
jgi:hypothetical protein